MKKIEKQFSELVKFDSNDAEECQQSQEKSRTNLSNQPGISQALISKGRFMSKAYIWRPKGKELHKETKTFTEQQLMKDKKGSNEQKEQVSQLREQKQQDHQVIKQKIEKSSKKIKLRQGLKAKKQKKISKKAKKKVTKKSNKKSKANKKRVSKK